MTSLGKVLSKGGRLLVVDEGVDQFDERSRRCVLRVLAERTGDNDQGNGVFIARESRYLELRDLMILLDRDRELFGRAGTIQ